ncbi:uncharacterized protein LOC144097029 [Amblyomma americanum]
MCRCPARFVAASDGSSCLSESVVWHPLVTVLFPAVLLILAFIVLASYGYYRLTTPGGDKLQTHQNSTSALATHGSTGIQRLRKWFEGNMLKPLHYGVFSRSRMRSFALSALQSPRMFLARWQWPKYDRFGQETGHAEGGTVELTPIAGVTNRSFDDYRGPTLTAHAVPSATLDPAYMSSQCPVPFMNATSPEACTEIPRQDRLLSSLAPESKVDDRLPAPKQRTKVSTLSTSTMMPCRLKRRRNIIFLSTSTGAEAPTVRTLPGYSESGHNVPREAAEEFCGEKDVGLPQFQTRPASSFRFTESELSSRLPKRFKSELALKPDVEVLRRVASEDLDAKAKEDTVYSSSSYASSVALCVPASESLGWISDSFTEQTEHKTSGGFEDWRPLPSTFPVSAFRHGACKHVDHRLLAWNTFTMHNGSARPGDGRAPMTDPVAKGVVHRDPEMQPYVSVLRPPTADRTRWRRGPLTYGTTSPASISLAPRSSTGFALSDVASGGRMQCSGEAAGRRSPTLRESTTCPIGHVASHATRLVNPSHLDRESTSLEPALLAAMLRAERRAKGSYF